MRRLVPVLLPACAAALALIWSSNASAQSRLESGSTWRQRSRAASSESSLYSFTLELRFGGYYPRVDEEFGGVGPYTELYGKGPQFYFGVEIDWTPIRIPYVGRLGPLFGWGFTTMNAKASLTAQDATGADETQSAGNTTTLSIHPMHASAVLRIDEIARRTVLPIVPYVKGGFGFAAWSTGTNVGTSKIGTDCDAVEPADCTVGEGMSVGPQLAVGAMLGLNWLDRRSAATARESAGIDQAYLFGEWMYSDLRYGVNKPPMYVGTSSWVLGVAVDF